MKLADLAYRAHLALRRSPTRLLALLLVLVLASGCGTTALPAPIGIGGSGNLAALAFGMLGQSTATGNQPLIVGHRGGAAGRAPENTMAAFRLGPTFGAAVIECDVQCSKDGALVIIHDTTVDRTTNGIGPVHQFTLAQLQQLDAGGGERIPTLEELLAWTASQPSLGLTIEIKAKRKVCPDIADKVVAAVSKASLGSRTVIISFHRDAVERVEQVQPDLRTGLLFLLRLNPIRTAKRIHADLVWPYRQRTTTRFVESAHEAKLGVFSWTLNVGKHLLEARRVGVDAVVTDVPDIARNAFEHGPGGVPATGGDASESIDPEDREDPEDLESEAP